MRAAVAATVAVPTAGNSRVLRAFTVEEVDLDACELACVCIINTDYGTRRFYEKGDYLAHASCA